MNSPVILPASREPKTWRAGTLAYTGGGVVILFCWLLFGDFAWSMRDRSVGPMAQWYLNSLSVPNLVFGLLMSSLPALISVVLAPVISVKSDRHRGRFGRRIPFLLITTPFAAAGMIGLGLTPIVARWVHGHFPGQSEMLVSVVCFGVFWSAFEFATIASQAVFGGLINDVVPKPLLGRFYGLFRAVSLIDGIIFNYWIMGKVPGHFTLILCIIGTFYGASFMLVCFKVKEGDYPPSLAPAALARPSAAIAGAGPIRFLSEVKRYCKECFTNPYYIALFILIKVAVMTFSPINTFSIPYARSLGVSMDTYGKCLALTFTISFSLSFFLGWLADAIHPLRMAILTLAAYIVVAIWGRFYVNTAGTFLMAWVAHGVISGCYFTSAASLQARLFPQSRYGQFASAVGVCTTAANMTLIPLVGLMIDRTGGAYRHAFTVAIILGVLALIAGLYVHTRFMKLGGPAGYVAPE